MKTVSEKSETVKSEAVDGVVIAGTTEGRQVLELLNRKSLSMAATVATETGAQALSGAFAIEKTKIYTGRRDEEGFAMLFRKLRPRFVVDASHPFAGQVSRTVLKVCRDLKIPCLRYVRREEAWEDGGKVQILTAADAGEAADMLSRMEGNILLTTGANTAPVYVRVLADFNQRAYIRVLDTPSSAQACLAAGIDPSRVICANPPFSVEDNTALIRRYHIKILVTKDSGKTGGVEEKLKAAGIAGAKVVMIRRPGEENQDQAASMDEVTAWVDHVLCG